MTPYDSQLNAELVRRVIIQEMVAEGIVEKDAGTLTWVDDTGREYLVEVKVFPTGRPTKRLQEAVQRSWD